MKSPDNNIISGYISRNQDIRPVKFLDTLFQMPKREFGFSGEKIKIIRVKWNAFINQLKNVQFPIIWSIRLNILSFTPSRTIII